MAEDSNFEWFKNTQDAQDWLLKGAATDVQETALAG